jgi:hypothetical protein
VTRHRAHAGAFVWHHHTKQDWPKVFAKKLVWSSLAVVLSVVRILEFHEVLLAVAALLITFALTWLDGEQVPHQVVRTILTISILIQAASYWATSPSWLVTTAALVSLAAAWHKDISRLLVGHEKGFHVPALVKGARWAQRTATKAARRAHRTAKREFGLDD